MTYKNPKVSVCIPNYNYGLFIEQAIQSVLDQTFTDFEIIVIDDCSTDNSISVIKSFSDERIKFFRNEKNIGRVKNINKCISFASGEYVTILPSDDIYLPTSLEKRVELLSNHRVGLVYSSVGFKNEDGTILREIHPFNRNYIVNGEEEFKKLIFANYMSPPTVMVRRECYITLGTFNEAVTGGADWEMWLRISLNNYDVAFIAEILAYNRVHSRNVTNYFSQTNLSGMNNYRVVKTVFSNLSIEKKFLSSLETLVLKALARNVLAMAGYNFICGQNNLARKNVGLAMAIDDGCVKNWRTYVILIATFINLTFLKKIIPNFIKIYIYRFGRKTLVEN